MNMNNDEDSILAALDKIKSWAMDRMVKKNDPQEHQEPDCDDSGEEDCGDEPGEPDADNRGISMKDGVPSEELIEIEAQPEPKNSVLKRYDFAGRGRSSSPEMQMKRGRGRPPKAR